MKVLGVDPSLRGTGYAVVSQQSAQGEAVAENYGTIHCPPKLSQAGCLLRIEQGLGEVIAHHKPDCFAVEGVIYVQSYKTAIVLGAARGAALLAAARAGLEIFEYAPKRVKQSVVGRGAADKSQVAFMTRALLGLRETPQADAADALAIALTHLKSADSVAKGLLEAQRL